jgi:putative SOS response-associated peptidase YedK
MCGRYTLSVPLSNLVDTFDVPPPHFEFQPRFNIAPTQEAPVLAEDEGGRRIGLLRWGLIPSWAKDPSIGGRLINARSETVADKPAFRRAFRRRRCLVLADGFFEWKKEGERGKRGEKVPYWIHLPSRKVFTMAGIWERWEPKGGDPLYTFSILTTEAAPRIRPIHPRMPVILSGGDRDRWLDPGEDPESLAELLGLLEKGSLEAYPVSTLVNSPRNDTPACIEPADQGGQEGSAGR